MLKIGYTLSSEEHDPQNLVKFAQIAEVAGFQFLGISDHYHPWVDNQGQSPFVWNVIGALSEATSKVDVFVEVNCPILRYHPAIIAQAAATSQYQLNGRFFLGVGTGENLNEHVVGKGWPPIKVRQEMLEEAIKIMRQLWEGGYQTYFGKFFNIDAARIYTMPEEPIPVIVSAMAPNSAEMAGRIGDGLVTTSPDPKIISKFEDAGGKGKSKFIQMSVCFDQNPETAKKIAKEKWPNAGIPKPLNVELRLPRDFQNTAQLVSEDKLAEKIIVGADPKPVIEKIQKLSQAGFEYVYIHNIGPNQEEFLEWAEKEILPEFQVASKQRSTEVDNPQLAAFAHDVSRKNKP
jgi:coenzyme F420-dependent glucose-6-phosphate dehydrogenase